MPRAVSGFPLADGDPGKGPVIPSFGEAAVVHHEPDRPLVLALDPGALAGHALAGLVAAPRARRDRDRHRVRDRLRGGAAGATATTAFETPIGLFTAFLYTIPSIAAFEILLPITGITWTTVEIPLVAYTLLILFRNILAGLRGVPDRRPRGGPRRWA